jgi:hypothetical protein
MQLSDTFWKLYELDFQEVKIAYLNWAIGYAKEPKERYRHLFLCEHQEDYCLIDSRYGRAFSISPFGVGVRGVPRTKIKGISKGLDEIDMGLINRLSYNTQQIRKNISNAIDCNDIETARNAVLNYFWIKLGIHEIYFDRIQYGYDNSGKIRKGKFNFLQPENFNSLQGIRNKIINVIRFGDILEIPYVKVLNKKLPGFSKNSFNTFLSGSMTWNRYGLCAFDCGPVVWSKKGFVHFNQVQKQMEKIGWPYHGTASKLLRPLYTIALNYKRLPIRRCEERDEGYSAKSLRQRVCQIYEILDDISEKIQQKRESLLNK